MVLFVIRFSTNGLKRWRWKLFNLLYLSSRFLDQCHFHNLDHEDQEFLATPSVAHIIIGIYFNNSTFLS